MITNTPNWKILITILVIIVIDFQIQAQSPLKWAIEMDTMNVEEYAVKWSKKKVYLRANYGKYKILNPTEINRIKGKNISKIDVVYTDYPKGIDLQILIKQRLASLYLLLPEIFEKPWIEWSLIKQVNIKDINDAHQRFHGFVVHLKGGSAPNAVREIPKEILEKMKNITVEVEIQDTTKLDQKLKEILEGENVKITNLKMSNPASMAYNFTHFKDNKNSLEIIEGVLMTTGLAANALGPNDSPSATMVWSSEISKDLELQRSAGKYARLYDKCVLEFDVEMLADTLIVDYVFASEEYPEYLNFNDIFGIYVRYKSRVRNIARVPFTYSPVSVGSINHLQNQDLYVANDYFNSLYLFKTWQYDGFTTLLHGQIPLQRGKKYHLKIAIADYGDPLYDSAVFLKARGVRAK